MKRYLFCSFLVVLLTACGDAPPAPYGVLPTESQLRWHEMEMYCLIHFSMGTFTDKEWGYGDEDPSVFNPSDFNAYQIVNAAKEGGFKGVVVVAKHHDGFCLWPTKTTGHNISKSPWKNGKGDIIREFQQACKQAGMKLGLYCSPWDRNSSLYGKPEYVNLYREQLKELYSNYGPLFISWHDGANGGDGYYGGARELRKIDRTTYYGWDTIWKLTRKMQPSAVIFGDVGPDVRWVGNEKGYAGETCWATYTPQAPDEGREPANGYAKSAESIQGTRNGRFWMPAECDVPLRPGWFYHQSQDLQVKSPYELLDLYYQSVGRGACLDLGLAPDQRGQLPEEDVRSLKQLGGLLKQIFAENLAKGARLTASNIRGNNESKFGPDLLLDDDRYSYWATDDSVTTPNVIVELSGTKTFNLIRLRENIKLGQRIDSIVIDVLEGEKWRAVAGATSIGSNRLIRLPEAVTCRKLRLRVEKAAACIALSDFSLFREPEHTAVWGRVAQNLSAPKSGWKINGPVSLLNGNNAIDGDPATIAETEKTDSIPSFPQEIEIDMGKVEPVIAFTYLPRQDKRTEGMADKFVYAVSNDGKSWREVARGEFSNIKANPIEQVTWLKNPVKTRYYKLSVLRMVAGDGISIAESGVLIK